MLTLGDLFLFFPPDAGLSALRAKVVLILLGCYPLNVYISGSMLRPRYQFTSCKWPLLQYFKPFSS